MTPKLSIMGVLKTILTLLQVAGVLATVGGAVLYLLYPDAVTDFFMGFVGMPSTLSAEEVAADPDKAMEGCANAMKQLRDMCYYGIAPKMAESWPDKAVQSCNKISDSQTAGGCYMAVADVVYDTDPDSAVNACAAIENAGNRDGCYRTVFLKTNRILTNSSLSISICEKLSDEQDSCYSNIARTLRGTDPDEGVRACQNIKDKYSQYDCFGESFLRLPDIVKANPDKAIEVCKMLTVNRDSCFYDVARTLRSTNPDKAILACDEMADVLNRDNCYGEVWTRVQSTVQKYPDESISICAKWSTNNDDCYWDVARALSAVNKNKAVEACKKITDASQRNGCKENYG